MKKSLLLSVLCIVAIGLLSGACEKKKFAAGEGLRAPELAVQDIVSGGKIDPDTLKGKVVFINFWASWCPPCKEEMPSIESLNRGLSGNSAFAMVTVLYKDDARNGIEYMKANGYTFPVFADSEGISAGNFGVTGVPETYLVDKKGIVRKRVIGPATWDSSEATAFIQSLLNE